MVRGYGEAIGVDTSWPNEDPPHGALAAANCQVVTVSFNSTGLAPYQHLAALQINSNDPDEPTVTLPVTLNVGFFQQYIPLTQKQ